MAGQNSTQNVSELAAQVATHLQNKGLIAKPKAKRVHIAWERYLVYEYLLAKYPTYPQWTRKEVGNYEITGNKRLYSRTREWADAIVILPEYVLIIEAKMKARPGAVAQVYSYAQKFHETPEFSAYADLPVKALIVSAVDEPSVKELADKFGVLYDVFKPTVYDEWFKKTVIDVNNKNNEED